MTVTDFRVRRRSDLVAAPTGGTELAASAFAAGDGAPVHPGPGSRALIHPASARGVAATAGSKSMPVRSTPRPRSTP